ncbi:endolytic transglycosylase MltG [Candidatus Falkowbacteria bacterium CG10_big_fil_rev_8_21_14_0_10_37_14]|uniref:Endolytic murein transglycosylase n=1 Tax=Candidatus Falkowbacteria bacterium CG10_big_fil_rev_8_21_14_0_10_37_14 TaxID=1974561 RepID=A0A2M6WT56_9BACT|nr:endolytic transglycosylase MltG [Candidatus Falkowbacteria bacterium]PIT95987.1 MAG: endolytic transglycosylase MltG [Candidatus Falkowbacteria bacterium CG10_big_fil_rev_8_21_14_0_10_37_14]
MKKFIVIIGVIIILGLLTAGFVYWLAVSPVKADSVDFTVHKGETSAVAANQLKLAGLIRSKTAFIIMSKLSNLKLKAGAYKLPTNPTPDSIINVLQLGPRAGDEKTILIKEGVNNKAIEEYLKTNNLIIDGSFLKIATTLIGNLPAEYQKFDFIKEAPKKVDLEGFLFPDTYRLFINDGGEQLIAKQLNNFDNKVTPEMRAEIKRQGKSLYEIIVMASIVEKEVRSTADMKIVAGIFWDRMKNSQRLESCATLAYILGVNKLQYSYEDTQIDSPFNTYRNDGLPPTPIGNPGIRAIEAAIYPEYTGYQFFLTASDGQTIWAKTFEQHKANKAKYLK